MIKKKIMLFLVFFIFIVVAGCSNGNETTNENQTSIIEEVTTSIEAFDYENKEVAVHRQNAIYIDDGQVFTKGENRNGQLGNGSFTDSDSFVDITEHFNLQTNETIISVDLGEYHALALSSEGRVFAWGHSAYAKLGMVLTEDQNTPMDITSEFNLNDGEEIAYIEAGRDHNGVITSAFRVFTWGVNAYGQLGIGQTTNPWEDVVEGPQDITEMFSSAVVKLDFGNNHSLALTENGDVYAFGDNALNQLGSSFDQALSPTNISSLFDGDVKDISVGYDHSGVLTESGKVFVFGDNQFRQLGMTGINMSDGPMDISDEFTNVLDIEFGHNSSSVSTETGVYVFGYNFYSQLGLSHSEVVNGPTMLNDSDFGSKTISRILIAKEVFALIFEDGSTEVHGPF